MFELRILCLLSLISHFVLFQCNGSILQPAARQKRGTDQQRAWNQLAFEELNTAKQRKENVNRAKNVILFLGDGMSMSTVVASRILKGQLQGRPGEEGYLMFEKFPNVAFLKTYNVDYQVPDSAATSTAYLTGVKANYKTLGVDENVLYRNCSSYDPQSDVISSLIHAMRAGKEAGIVSTDGIAHGSAAGVYAHSASRYWTNDGARNKDVQVPLRDKCLDHASQLLKNGIDFRLVFGGGRSDFQNESTPDVEYSNKKGKRQDGRDLIEEWKQIQKSKGRKPRYVWNKEQFEAIDENGDEFILGLFNPVTMSFNLDEDQGGEPTLEEMTTKAIKILSRNPNGYFLFVEGALIDGGHHKGIAKKALMETLEFEKAIATSVRLTNEEDTLILVTADHSHVMTIAGYPSRGNDILGLAKNKDSGILLGLDNLPYTTLLYATGSGAQMGTRKNITHDDVTSNNYHQPALVPLKDETHGGDDVAVYARGPMGHLFQNCHEQSYLAHVMMYAACIGDYTNSANHCYSNDALSLQKRISTQNYLLYLTSLMCLPFFTI